MFVKTFRTFSLGIVSVLLALSCLTASLCACSDDKAVMSLGGEKITPEMYTYWLSADKSNLLALYNNKSTEEEFWNSVVDDDGMTAEQYGDGLVADHVRRLLASSVLFGELGLSISAETAEDISETISSYIREAGSEEALDDELALYGFNTSTLRAVYETEAKLDTLRDALFGEGGTSEMTQTQYLTYLQKNYSLLKLIVIYTDEKLATDEDGHALYDDKGGIMTVPLTDAEQKEKRDLIEKVAAELSDGADFDSAMSKYSEVDSSYYKNGFFISGQSYSKFGTALVAAAAEMAVGETRTVEQDGVVYIARKFDIPAINSLADCDLEQLTDTEELCREELFLDYLAEKISRIKENSALLATFSIRSAVPCSLY